MRFVHYLHKRYWLSQHKMAFFVVPIALLLLADSIMAYSYPILVETSLMSNTQLGIIMASSSVFGMITDFLIPVFFSRHQWHKFLILGFAVSIMFPVTSLLGSSTGMWGIFLLGSALWGIYFEFMGFSMQDFVVSEERKENFTRDWGLLNSVWQATTIFAPIVAGSLLAAGGYAYGYMANGLQILGLISAVSLYLLYRPQKSQITKRTKDNTTLTQKGKILAILFKRMFPIFGINLLMGIVVACFWTIGGLFGETLGEGKYPEWLVLVVFNLATLMATVFMWRENTSQNKIFIARTSALFAGFVAVCFGFVHTTELIYILVFALGFFVMISQTLTDSICSEIGDRDKNIELYLLTISRISTSSSYIIGPFVSGVLADSIGYQSTFSVVGTVILVIIGLSWTSHPKPLRLPHKELYSIQNP